MKSEGQHQEVQSRTLKPALQKHPQGAYMVDSRNMPQVQLMDMIQRSESKTPQFVDSRDNSQIRLMKVIQRMGMEDEDPLQGKFEPIQQKPNNTGLPDNLKSGVENMSGFSMDDVQVHYNSDKPAQMQAHAYAQGTDIHVAQGQEKHLPHEAWHVVQQKQGRVQPTMQMQGVKVNRDTSLEMEADVMGDKAGHTISMKPNFNTIHKSTIEEHSTLQLATKIIGSGSQLYKCGSQSCEVGSYIEVGLDPYNMEQGQIADLNKAQDPMMQEIRKAWGIQGVNLVKGHLWNDNLGGNAMNYNLYPITKAANSDHLYYAENIVKTNIYKRIPVYYKVEVDADATITEPVADFDCEIRRWDPKTSSIGSLLCEPITIRSDLRNVGAYGEAFETYTGYPIDRFKSPKAPKWLTAPKTRVGELTKRELLERKTQGGMR